ncbi:hypothetical protein [Actinacidiphila bryophytorum]|uniref:Uncharacterized protein n=1 Tax=Actinacidiphila bryophytorum TaxID=1436133 RepID=A0A9W4E975_9ACTN|nr:hypothetical protein [Actinacidiphila bryophytorum]MBM9434428.1 hypothetical protein [Actinacidiphila bryophytorum]MBN6541902.1 hypothetical protein [Actinacidiphila bryophytorum]CAG7625985.1 hypothetical protein SBRY_20216 [Actinacidiphila bryophytorum]
MIKPDPELLRRILAHVRERGNTNRDVVARLFFAGDIRRVYPYMNQLTAERHVFPLANGKTATAWIACSDNEEDSEEEPEESAPATEPEPARPKARDFADGEVYEVALKTIRDVYGYTQVKQFRNMLRSHTRRHPEFRLSFQRTPRGVKFCLGIPPLRWSTGSQPGHGGWRPRSGWNS